MENDAKFILHLATTLDGYIASSDGSIEWMISFETNGEDNGYIAFYETIDALVMGSATYEQVVGFGDWPYLDKLSYVLTNRNLSTNRNDVVFVSDVKAILEDVKRKGFKGI